MSIERILAEMVSILDRKSQRLKLILDLTRRQGELLSVGGINKLAEILQIKQECMDDIDHLDKLYNVRYKSYSERIDEIRKKCETDSSINVLMGRQPIPGSVASVHPESAILVDKSTDHIIR
jgi:hypothetical protein